MESWSNDRYMTVVQVDELFSFEVRLPTHRKNIKLVGVTVEDLGSTELMDDHWEKGTTMLIHGDKPRAVFKNVRFKREAFVDLVLEYTYELDPALGNPGRRTEYVIKNISVAPKWFVEYEKNAKNDEESAKAGSQSGSIISYHSSTEGQT